MRSYTGLDIVFRLLNGTLSGEDLEEALTTKADLYLGPWNEVLKARELNALLNSPTALAAMFGSETAFAQLLDIAGAEMAASDSATELISNTSSAILTVVTNTSYLNLWQNVPANKSRLQARVNASGSKLLRWDFTASGTWTVPGGGLVALSVFAVGGGGNGGAGNNSGAANAGAGGSGGESKTIVLTSGLPETNQTVTVGGAAASSSFGAILSAAGGANGGTGTNAQTTGGGTTSGTIYDTAPENGVFQPATASKQGGNGGAGFARGSNSGGQAGVAGLTGSGGAAGVLSGSAGGGGAGSGYGSGGGSGAGIWPAGAGASGGTGAAANSGCGAGGSGASASTGSSGGAGGTGRVVVYGVAA